jgi:hypothetical protein
MYKIILLTILFLISIFVYSRQETWRPSISTTFYSPQTIEGVENISEECPNLLLQKGAKYYLYNRNRPEAEGINPIEFSSLDQYVTYIGEQRRNGLNCPILYVQQTLGAQGDTIYRVRATPQDPQGGMPPPTPSQSPSPIQSSAQSPYDQKMYMDNLAQTLSNNLSISQAKNVDKLELTKSVLTQNPGGCPTSIDHIKPLEVKGKTADPMTDNWGGPQFSQQLIDQGYYAGNEVYIAV